MLQKRDNVETVDPCATEKDAIDLLPLALRT
jgi:hypothetical protein